VGEPQECGDRLTEELVGNVVARRCAIGTVDGRHVCTVGSGMGKLPETWAIDVYGCTVISLWELSRESVPNPTHPTAGAADPSP
jgi:hypothetical protein